MVILGESIMIDTTYLAIKNIEKWYELENQFIQDINDIFKEWEKEKDKSINDNHYKELFEI